MASRSVICYPQHGKERSRVLLDAFAKGCGGRLGGSAFDSSCDAAFYGLVGIEYVFNQARSSGVNWYYGDNGYFDVSRQRYFRFTRNAFQNAAPAVAPDHDRLRGLGVSVKPWTQSGRKVLVVEQSEHFLNISAAGDRWLARTVKQIKLATDRPIELRLWRRDKDKATISLREALKDAWCLVTHMSAAANEALVAGVPAFVTGPCAAAHFARSDLSKIEDPVRPDGREDWAAKLAACQWTVEEICNGTAWRSLNG